MLSNILIISGLIILIFNVFLTLKRREASKSFYVAIITLLLIGINYLL